MLLDDYPNSKIEIINSLSGSIGIKLLIDEAINLVKEKIPINSRFYHL